MPTLEFLSRIEDRSKYPPITLYGHESSLFADLDELLDDVQRGDDQIRDDKDKIQSTLLRVGPCPGSARLFYLLTTNPEYENPPIESILGNEVDWNRRKAGRKFEEWINDANEAVNVWLETTNDSVFDDLDIPDSIITFYRNRIESIQTIANQLDVDLPEVKMEVQYSVESDDFHTSHPDGVWMPNEFPGGVFESKLSLPPDPSHRYRLAGYACQIERAYSDKVDFGIYLYTDDNDQEIELESFYIDNVLRSAIGENVSDFANLAYLSIEEGEWDESEPIKDRLVEPKEPKYTSDCKKCPVFQECHTRGKYFDLAEDVYGEISNFKLDPNDFLDVLSAIDEAGDRRSDVIRGVMEHYPEKSEKSVFRGMVIPTTTRLHLVRTAGTNSEQIFLAPNGKAIVNSDDSKTRQTITDCLRDFLIIHLELTRNAIDFFYDYADDIANSCNLLPGRRTEPDEDDIRDVINRLNRDYINEYGIALPEEDSLTDDLVGYTYQRRDELRFLTDNESRRNIISNALVEDRQLQTDIARWRVIRELQNKGLSGSSWFVDEILWREYQSDESTIDLYKGSTIGFDKLIRGATPYEGVILTNSTA